MGRGGRVTVAVAAVALLAATAGVPAATLPIPPPDPAPVLDGVLEDALGAANASLAQARAEVGDLPEINSARVSYDAAAAAFAAGDTHQVISHLADLHGWLNAGTWWAESLRAGDAERQYMAKAQAGIDLGATRIRGLHERLVHLQGAGVDLFMLDGAIATGDLLTNAETLIANAGPYKQAWDGQNRGPEIRYALAGVASGPVVLAEIGGSVLTATAAAAPERPVGPVLGNSTGEPSLDGLSKDVLALMQDSIRSQSPFLGNVLNDDLAEDEYLAFLGGVLAWARQQPRAEASTTPELVTQDEDAAMDRFTQALRSDILGITDGLGVQGIGTRHALRAALWTHWNIQKEIENRTDDHEDGTGGGTGSGGAAPPEGSPIVTAIGSGMGELSAARMATSILRMAAGGPPLDPVMVFPFTGASTPVDGPTSESVPTWLWAIGGGVAVVTAGAAFLLKRRD